MSMHTIPAEATGSLTAECGDVMLARECLANLKGAQFHGETSLDLPHSVEELESRGYVGFGSPIGESSARGALIGGVLGLALAAVVSSLPADWLMGMASPAALLGAVFAAVGGLAGFLRGRRLLSGRSNDRGVTLRCTGNADEITRALETLQKSPCQEINVQFQTAPSAA